VPQGSRPPWTLTWGSSAISAQAAYGHKVPFKVPLWKLLLVSSKRQVAIPKQLWGNLPEAVDHLSISVIWFPI